jgi:hypothetical protein
MYKLVARRQIWSKLYVYMALFFSLSTYLLRILGSLTKAANHCWHPTDTTGHSTFIDDLLVLVTID